MASSYLTGQDEDYASNTYASFSAQESLPPSPDGISAAHILAALSDSRPPTSHGEDAQELVDDDDETGGISLIEHVQNLAPVIPTSIGEVIYSSGSQNTSNMENSQLYSTLDQHTVALEALTMQQLPTPPASTAPPTIPEQFTSMHPLEGWPTAYEEHLSIQDVTAFLEITPFFHYYATSPKPIVPGLDMANQPDFITRDMLLGEECDFQGIDWRTRGTRAEIRAKRMGFEKARLQHRTWHDRRRELDRTSNTENFFSFRRMNTRHRAVYPHFQLRNVMASTSRNDVYYATKDGIFHTDVSGSPATPIIDIRKRTVNGNPCQITTLAAMNNVLIAGGFEGEYAIVDLSSTYGTPFNFGTIKDWVPETKSYITNHVHLFNHRNSYTPQAVLCSNDSRLRVLDCMTNTFRYSFTYPSAVNCSATSPDGRMRVVVGDFSETLITNAETGQPFETLKAHNDDAFACAWADDGIHVATAAQDSTIAVWDARYWRRPVALLSSELSIPRILRFSPVGGGPRVLVAAEADDYINIINAQTFESKQTFDFFGPTAGISMTPDGQSLFIANAERRFGGIIELERTGLGGADPMLVDPYSDDEAVDWKSDGELDQDRRVLCSSEERHRRGLDLGNLVV